MRYYNHKINKPARLILFTTLVVMVVTACIEEFSPQIDETGRYLAINGGLIKGDSVQAVNISLTKSFNEPSYEAISNCQVWVEDKEGNRFDYSETSHGKYTTVIPEEYLRYKSEFRLGVITEDGKQYQSDYEPILESAPVDTVYPLIDSYQSSSEYFSSGYQFYIDLKAIPGGSNNYLWKLQETYEYHSKHFIYGTWYPSNDPDLDTVIFLPPNQKDSLSVCYATNNIAGVYTASTENLTVNEKKKIPLNYISGTEYKLEYKYSLLVKQYALSDAAYEYWEANKTELSESGGLYQTQPSQTKSNIYNIKDPEELVVGFFWASSYTEGRIFVKKFLGSTDFPYTCKPDTVNDFESLDFPMDWYYLTALRLDPEDTVWATTSRACFDCRIMGGELEKPEFW